MVYRVYLDVCCLNRPFDDWAQARVRLEAEAVLTILKRCEAKDWDLVNSAALESEIARTPDPARRQRVLNSLSMATQKVFVADNIVRRAANLQQLGIKAFDALHLACAESADVDVLLTTDDRLLRKTESTQSELVTRVANPVIWLMSIQVE
ncbi:MAG: PIN domain-containing protein [Cyanobacteria bacterium J06634_5]